MEKVMSNIREEYLGYDQALDRLHQIVNKVRSKEVGLEESVELLEEAVQLTNICTENIDKTQWLAPNTDDEHDQSVQYPVFGL